MSFDRPLSGRCRCGRNRYVVDFPREQNSPKDLARVLFDSHPSHRRAQASPLAAFLRVPLAWYHSTTFPFYPDETNSMIKRAYTPPQEQHCMRHFCGFCGTPLSYWSEEPRSEAEFIQVTLGSLCSKDLADLEDLGLLPDSENETEGAAVPATPNDTHMTDDEVVIYNGHAGRGTLGALPWFDTLTAGSRLGNLRAAKGKSQSQDGSVRVEWEILEWTEDDGNTHPGKRKIDEVDSGSGNVRMEGV